jgi:predicted O-methyltransferase YrrM
MYSRWQLAKKFTAYYTSSLNGRGHGIHSPFLFDFVKNVLNDKRHFYAYGQVEKLRSQLLEDPVVITIKDFGAGSTVSKTNQRSIASIAKHAAKSRKFAQLLFRMANYYQPKTILELGTSLGISTAYMALGNQQASVITAEGSDAIAAKARQNFQQLGLSNIQQVTGNFDDTLPGILQSIPQLDFAFLDGNHRLAPTLQYFDQLFPHLHNDSMVILDDIHWSAEMEQAWTTIQQKPGVQVTVDLFFIGIVLFSDQFKVKQHVAIRF